MCHFHEINIASVFASIIAMIEGKRTIWRHVPSVAGMKICNDEDNHVKVATVKISLIMRDFNLQQVNIVRRLKYVSKKSKKMKL